VCAQARRKKEREKKKEGKLSFTCEKKNGKGNIKS
jgi:hypothetical protein